MVYAAAKKEKVLDGAFYVIAAYLFFEFVRPQDLYGFLGIFKIPMLLILSMLFLFVKGDKSFFKDKMSKLLFMFLVAIVFSMIKAINHYSVYKSFETIAIFLFAFCYPFVQYINTKEKVFALFRIWVYINIIFGLVVISNGGVGSGSFNHDENDAAMILNMGIPFAFYLAFSKMIGKKTKIIFLAGAVVMTIAMIATASRGGFLGFIAIAGFVWYQSEKRVQYAVYGAVAGLLLSGAVLQMLPEEYVADMQTISDDGDATRNERIYSWDIGWQMFIRNPLLGVGANNYQWLVPHYAHYSSMYTPEGKSLGGRKSHSLYFTLIPELGLFGIIVYFWLIKLIYSRCIELKKGQVDDGLEDDEKYEYALLGKACLCSMITFLVTGTFITVLYYPPFWFLCAFVIAIYRTAQPAEESKPREFGRVT